MDNVYKPTCKFLDIEIIYFQNTWNIFIIFNIKQLLVNNPFVVCFPQFKEGLMDLEWHKFFGFFFLIMNLFY